MIHAVLLEVFGEIPRDVTGAVIAVDLTPSLVRASCDLLGWFQLGRKCARRQVSECRLWPFFVEVYPPLCDPLTGVSHRQEP